jgi:hypothetical protein
VTHSGDHILDETLSALLDEQLSGDEARITRAHLDVCSACQERLEHLRSVVAMLRGLPELAPPRDFVLGPRIVAEPPNVVRLRRWYTVARAGAASLAAVFVLLSLGVLYVDSQPVSGTPAPLPGRAQFAAAPAAASQTVPTVSARVAAPAAAVRPAAPSPQSAESDQVAAATSIRPLPTPVPTPSPTAVPIPLTQPVTSADLDPAAPLRTAAVVVGVLAALTVFATLLVRHRLRSA